MYNPTLRIAGHCSARRAQRWIRSEHLTSPFLAQGKGIKDETKVGGGGGTPQGTPPREDTYTEYEAMVVTPDGSIIDIRNVSRRRKPETDPDWEEREAERKAAKARRLSD